jgi:hypothetical protein
MRQTIFTPSLNLTRCAPPSKRLAPPLAKKRQTFFQMVTLHHPTCAILCSSSESCHITHPVRRGHAVPSPAGGYTPSSVITRSIQPTTQEITHTHLMQTTSHPLTNNAESKLSKLSKLSKSSNLSNWLPHHHAYAESDLSELFDLSDLRPHPSRIY